MKARKLILINTHTWKEFKKHCIDKDTSMSQRIETLLQEDLKKKG